MHIYIVYIIFSGHAWENFLPFCAALKWIRASDGSANAKIHMISVNRKPYIRIELTSLLSYMHFTFLVRMRLSAVSSCSSKFWSSLKLKGSKSSPVKCLEKSVSNTRLMKFTTIILSWDFHLVLNSEAFSFLKSLHSISIYI